MKSVVAEASSIAKAIELAWQKAGQPKEFLTKVFQEPQRNMFGLTKTSAKVGIFFDDAAIVQKIKTASQSTIQPTHNSSCQAKPISTNKPATPKPAQAKAPQPRPVAPKPARPASKPENLNMANKNQSKDILAQPLTQTVIPTATAIVSPVNNFNKPNLELNPEVNQTLAPSNIANSAEPKPRRKYYHRRKPKAPRPSNGNDGNNKPSA